MAEQQNSPFARVSNGYDPKQVAAFAAEALSWKKELSALRSEVAAASKLVERYESVIGSIEDAEREIAEMVEEAERRAARIIEEAEDQAAVVLGMAPNQVQESAPTEPIVPQPEDGDGWLNPEPGFQEAPDLVEQIFEPIEDYEPPETDVSLERRAAGAANLWKRRGIVAPSE